MPESEEGAAAAARPQGMFAGYRPLPGCRDEMSAEAGTLWPHWEYLSGAIAALGEVELERRAHELRRLLRENGVTYNFYEDNDTVERGERRIESPPPRFHGAMLLHHQKTDESSST